VSGLRCQFLIIGLLSPAHAKSQSKEVLDPTKLHRVRPPDPGLAQRPALFQIVLVVVLVLVIEKNKFV